MSDVFFHGKLIKTIGSLPPIGAFAPDFTVTKTDLSEMHLKNYLGKIIVMNIFPSLDTETCATTMLHFNELSKKYPDVLTLCISVDLPFAQKRFCETQHLTNVQPVSVFRHPGFGKDYGITLISDPLIGLLARAVLILDTNGQIIYAQLVNELTAEPDYDAIEKTLDKLMRYAYER